MMRDAWRPVEQRLARGAGGLWGFVVAHPTLTQGVYYLLTGLWPWVHLGSFLAVSGDKTDLWLVQTVGALIAVIGAALCVAAYRHEDSWAITCLTLGSALALAFVDVFFVSQRRIPPVYLLDAVIEAGLIALWLHAWWVRRQLAARAASLARAAQAPAAPPPPAFAAPVVASPTGRPAP
jgi:hypothetical protein